MTQRTHSRRRVAEQSSTRRHLMVADSEHIEVKPPPMAVATAMAPREPPDDAVEEPVSRIHVRQEHQIVSSLREVLIGSSHRHP
jgi:hypothetical protein